MNELIKVNINENQEPVISGRELHKALEIGTQYSKWFERMADYGFSENIDFTPISQKRLTAQGNYTEYTDHILKLDMAKEISMIQRSDYQRPDGTIGSTIHTYWTQKGRMFLYDMLKNQNILPLIERGD